uniref:Conserved hypothetical phage tail region protein n=1 Tax=Candidatus Kentrum sp. DK TaxID=2126562 RepID=A0A450RV79_9GAMM|nr:MAG: conserved hypothetical phage tail region protein [Candidatus Kentron sp. DK]VFJ55607.1 MAG: conserved hypothetical phage tail region protein [Candidatus Kentron sp. DK]
MAHDKAHIKSNYPLPAYNYRVMVGNATLGFSEVSGLDLQYEPVIYKHGLSFFMGTKIIPGMPEPIRVTMKRGIVRNGNVKSLSEWMSDAYKRPFSLKKKRDVQIELCDENGQALVTWQVKSALPVRLSGPEFHADGNEIAIETMELVAYNMDIKYP